MGANLSSPQPLNPIDLNLSPPTSISPNSQNPDIKTPDNHNPDTKTLDDQNPETSDQPSNPNEKGTNQTTEIEVENNGEKGQEEEEEEEEGECGFCLYMKGGGCKDAFVDWEKCVEEGEKNKEDIADKCFEITGNLRKCMEAHSEYYEPILRAEKAAEEELKQELERQNGEGNVGSKADVGELKQDLEVEGTKNEGNVGSKADVGELRQELQVQGTKKDEGNVESKA